MKGIDILSNYRTWENIKKELNIKDADQIDADAKTVSQIFRKLDEINMSVEDFALKSGVSVKEIKKLDYERPSKELLNKITWIIEEEA